ncbi:MAG: hypothetical protein KF744_04525 [Taibaiella sp.]|nr:hypothetical protein [Taibaiella sp.]
MKRITVTAISTAIVLAAIIVASSSCHKTTGCYDKKLEAVYKERACTMDCPGATGCDGKTYCNSCIAAQHGIRTM